MKTNASEVSKEIDLIKLAKAEEILDQEVDITKTIQFLATSLSTSVEAVLNGGVRVISALSEENKAKVLAGDDTGVRAMIVIGRHMQGRPDAIALRAGDALERGSGGQLITQFGKLTAYHS